MEVLNGLTINLIEFSGNYSTQYVPPVVKGKAFPLQAWTGPWDSRELRLQNF
jgi:hypothetical protein